MRAGGARIRGAMHVKRGRVKEALILVLGDLRALDFDFAGQVGNGVAPDFDVFPYMLTEQLSTTSRELQRRQPILG